MTYSLRTYQRDLLDRVSQSWGSDNRPPRRISIGDAVIIRSIQQQGKIALWYRNRSKAVIEFEDDTLSDWVPSSELVRISDGAIEAAPDEPLPPLGTAWKPTISPSDDERDDVVEIDR